MGEAHLNPPLLIRRMFRHGRWLALGVAGTLLAGMALYRLLEGLSYADAFLNAAMLLGGMGPIAPIHTQAGKWLIGVYALWSGLLVIVAVGLVMAPLVHHIVHGRTEPASGT